MKIMLRTSGGRGEYELAGSQGDLGVADVLDREISFSITPEINIPGRSRCLRLNGKTRIRLEAAGRQGEMHAYGVMSGLLLLPEPKRELSETGTGQLNLVDHGFSVSAISVDIVAVGTDRLVLRPTALEFKNAGGSHLIMSVAERMAQVMEAWQAAALNVSPLAELVRAHKEAVLTTPREHSTLRRLASEIQRLVGTTGDCIRAVSSALGAPEPANVLLAPELPLIQEEDPVPPIIVRRRNLKTWRLVATRGPEATRFRADVRSAYNARCAFSGVRLPKLPTTDTAGVDAAHILPWSSYDLNAISNGLCLSKLFHWAFDNGVVRLDLLPVSAQYRLSIPDQVRDLAGVHNFDLSPFTPHLGVLPADRFPALAAQRPASVFLERLNAEIFGA